MPSFSIEKLIKEDKSRARLDVPFRFGKGFDVNINLSDGEWTRTADGRIWAMRFQSTGAHSINFIFENFYLSDHAVLYITNADETILYGPITSNENRSGEYFLTDLIQGEDVTINLFEPKDEIGKSRLGITKVVHAYKNMFSEACNNDIICFTDWSNASDAIGMVLLANGTEWCSGSLVMSADQSFKSFFLTAFHCIDSDMSASLSQTEINNAENWMFKFKFKKTTCGGANIATGITYNKATFRAAWSTTDFALMELNDNLAGDNRFSWLGWNRTTNTPISGAGIHHPSGDAMKISVELDTFQVSSWGGITIIG